MQTISRNEFINLLNKYPGDVFFADDKEINPLEITVIFDLSKSKSGFLSENIAEYLIEEDGKRRKLVWLDYKKFGFVSWTAIWKIRGKKLTDNVWELIGKDRDALVLWIVFFLSEKNTWVRRNSVDILKKRYSYNEEDGLYLFLGEYIKENKIRPKYKRICDMTAGYASYQSKKDLIIYGINQFIFKLTRKITQKRLTVKGFFHNIGTKKKFIHELLADGVLPEKWELINSGKGASSSTLIKAYRDGWIEFIKGNELKQYNALSNEIKTQKKLCEKYKYPEERWYLGMTSADVNEKWIGYPFLKYEDLSGYIKKNPLTKLQVERLGQFLCESVEKLKSINIVHNDFRTDNIMITVKDNGNLEFRLIDFGCAYVDGKSPWSNNYWGRYFGNVVCGDYRYSNWIVDDASSAYLVYIECGGKQEDTYAQKLKDLFGKTLFSIPYEWYGDK